MAAGRHLHVIVNPASGDGWARTNWTALRQRLCNLGFTITDQQTEGPGDATEIARRMMEERAEEILVVGGDGAVNEAANGILSTIHGTDRTPPILSVLPCGTGRDFTRSIGIQSFDHGLQTLVHGEVCLFDAGLIHYQVDGQPATRYFVNASDVGLGAATADWINHSSKRLGGTLTYMLGAARTTMIYRNRSARVVLDDTEIYNGELAMVVMANGRYHAGGMLMAPDATYDDGLFDVLILKATSKWQLLTSLLPRVYTGKHIGHSAVQHYQGRRVTISADEAMPFEVDGEQPGTTDLEAVLLAGALRVRCPGAQTPAGDRLAAH